MPSLMRVEVTLRNINWLLRYWECVQPTSAAVPATMEERATVDIWVHSARFPDPISDLYGFRLQGGGSKAVRWLDDNTTPA